MTDLNRSVAFTGADHQITRAESQRLVQEAGGSHKKLAKAIQSQGFSASEADRLAHRIETQARETAGSEPAAMVFPTPAPVRSDRAVDFATSAQARIDLLRSASQVNDVVGAIGNDICGGAAIISALILDSKSAEAARANAEALRATARSIGVPTAEVDEALAHMAEGRMTPADLQKLQKFVYDLTQALPGGSNPKGTDAGELGAVVGMLRARGAFQHSEQITFTMRQVAESGDSENVVDHWTVNVDRIHVNTWANDGANRSAIVEPASDPPGPGTAGWGATVRSHAACDFVSMAYADPQRDNREVRLELPMSRADDRARSVWQYMDWARNQARK